MGELIRTSHQRVGWNGSTVRGISKRKKVGQKSRFRPRWATTPNYIARLGPVHVFWHSSLPHGGVGPWGCLRGSRHLWCVVLPVDSAASVIIPHFASSFPVLKNWNASIPEMSMGSLQPHRVFYNPDNMVHNWGIWDIM